LKNATTAFFNRLLACKNAILVVEFAQAQREAGKSRYDATLAAVSLRLRPIILTSFAFILGVVPLVLSTGAGAEMRRTLGTAVFGGMLGVTLFGIFLTPVFYYVIEWFRDMWRGRGAIVSGVVAMLPRFGGRKRTAAPGKPAVRRLRKNPPPEFDAT
jgi:predicted RND superfamily exporter protein